MATLVGGVFSDAFAETDKVDPSWVSAVFPVFHFPALVLPSDVGAAAPVAAPDTQGAWAVVG